MQINRRNFASPWLVAGMWLLLAGNLWAGPARYNIKVWDTGQGLPGGAVISIIQSRDGYLWLGTLNGLARFDGMRFTVFNEHNTPGFDSSEIVFLFEDSRSNLWVGTQTAGVILVKDGRAVSLNIGEGRRPGRVMAAGEGADGDIWLYTADGQLARHRNGKADVWNAGGGKPSICRALAVEKSGAIWVGMDQGLFALRAPSGSNSTALVTEQEVPLHKLDFLLPGRDGGQWRLAEGHIQHWTTNGVTCNWPYPWPAGTLVTAACEDAEGNLIVGTLKGGLFWFDAAGHATSLSTADGLSNNSILSLLMDREGNLWAGTDGGGLNRVRRQVFDALPDTLGSTVQSVSGDAQGNVWIGLNQVETNADGVCLWKGGTVQRFGREQGLANSSIRTVFADQSGGVWAGAIWAAGMQGSLYQLRNGRFEQVLFAPVAAIHQDRAGHLWFGTPLGLLGRDEQNWKLFDARAGLSTNEVRAIADDRDGNLWLGTRGGGLNRLRDGKFTAFHKKDGLPSENISSLFVDRDGALWVGTTSSGLARFQDNHWTSYTTQDGLLSDSIGYLMEDDLGCLWIGSNNGLMRLSKKALNDFAAGRTNFIPCRAYGKEDGLPDNECTVGSQPGVCRARDGRLWFPTIKGLASVDPARLVSNTNPPPVIIESVLIEDHEVNASGLRTRLPGTVTIPASKERLEIQYTSLNLAAPDRARFKYRLEGHETAWTPVGNIRSAHYTKLSPGEYRFHVVACNEDGTWNEEGASLAIVVEPPFWRAWWFIAATSLGAIGLLVGAVHFVSTQRLQRQLADMRQQQALEKERARIARDIHDQVGASLTQVAFLGEMLEADKDAPGEIESHARQITQTARETSNALDEIVWTVNPSNDTLDGLVTYICKYAQDYLGVAGLRYRLDVPAELPSTPISPEVRHNVFLAAKEAITNVVKHARATSAFVRLRVQPGMFTVEIQDDGRGPAGLDDPAKQTRNGLRNMRKRMEDIGGTFAIGPAPEGGAIVRLAVPIGNGNSGSPGNH